MPVILVTNATTKLEADLDRLGIDGVVDHVVSGARVGFAKPDPRIYHEAARRARVAKNRCLFIDNTAAANALGMTAVHYKAPQQLRDAFAPFLDGDNGHDGPLQTR